MIEQENGKFVAQLVCIMCRLRTIWVKKEGIILMKGHSRHLAGPKRTKHAVHYPISVTVLCK